MPDRLYADNAATSFPKPPEVLEAMRRYAEELGASAGRGAYREAVETGELVADCRRRVARLIHASDARQIVFTLNCTEALNLAIKGLLKPGDHVVTSTMDHNSVLRPFAALKAQRGITVMHVQANAATGLVDPADMLAAVTPRTRLVALAHASNVTGTLQDVGAVGRELRKRGVPFLVDAAQTLGHLPVDVNELGIDLLAAPGHKGLMGPLGTGFLYIRPGLENQMSPLVEGGTGSVSEEPTQPTFMPDRFESGSHNAIGLAGLAAALKWIEGRSVKSLHEHDSSLSRRFLDEINDCEGITVFGPTDPRQRVAVFGLRVTGFEPAELSAALDADFGILSRSGIQCAPLAHETIGTLATGGTTRLSFGAFNTFEDVARCTSALRELASAAAPSA